MSRRQFGPRNSWLLPFESARIQTASHLDAVMTELKAVAAGIPGLDDRGVESNQLGDHRTLNFNKDRQCPHR